MSERLPLSLSVSVHMDPFICHHLAIFPKLSKRKVFSALSVYKSKWVYKAIIKGENIQLRNSTLTGFYIYIMTIYLVCSGSHALCLLFWHGYFQHCFFFSGVWFIWKIILFPWKKLIYATTFYFLHSWVIVRFLPTIHISQTHTHTHTPTV
jgi:hypothetical protein